MLEGLDRVPWGQLHHAFGPAEDVPNLIRALASADQDQRQAAFYELYGNIWHQGTIYEATPHAVPFLIELASQEQAPDRHQLLTYLGMLAAGASYADVHRGTIRRSKETFAAQLERELNWVAQTRSAVKAGEALYLKSIQSSEHPTCCAAAYVLSRFPSEAESYWSPLCARYEAEAAGNVLIRFGIAILTTEFSASANSNERWLRRMFETEEHPAVRIALAVSMAFRHEQPSNDHLHFLGTNLLANEGVEHIHRSQPWDSGELVWDVARALCLSKSGRGIAVARFNELLREGAPRDRLEYLHYVLRGALSAGSAGGLRVEPLGPLNTPDY